MTVITVRQLSYEELKGRLQPENRIVIFSCDNCARRCDGLGGASGLASLGDRLAADGFPFVHGELFAAVCAKKQLLARFADEGFRRVVEEADIVIPLACRMGIEKIRECQPALRILVVTTTLGKGRWSLEEGARLTRPEAGLGISGDESAGLTLAELARRLGLCAGSF